MKFCYVDESGMGQEPVATMVGIVVDAERMPATKRQWPELLEVLRDLTKRSIPELHFRELYRRNGSYNKMPLDQRLTIIDSIVDWITDRHHHIVYSSMVKADYRAAYAAKQVPDELNTIWRFLGFHLILAMQRRFQVEKENKGNTVFVFDRGKEGDARFRDLVLRPPRWSDEYYDPGNDSAILNQVIDTPYFADSEDVGLIQTADSAAYLLRRYAEVVAGDREYWHGEQERLGEWVTKLAARSIGRAHIYPRRSRTDAHNLFYGLAPEAIRDL